MVIVQVSEQFQNSGALNDGDDGLKEFLWLHRNIY